MFRVLVKSLVLSAFVLGLANLVGCNGARDDALKAVDTTGNTGFMIKEMTRGDRHRKYALFVPLNYNASKAYPVIIFLHGIGETGSDAHANLRVGLAPFVEDRASDFPFICIFPQSGGGWDANSHEAEDVIMALDDTEKAYNVDKDCVCLTGLSTGGVGTYTIGAKYKERFAALVPMGSNGCPQGVAPDLVNVSVHAFCNSGDMFAAFGGNDKSMVDKINSLGGRAEFTQTNGPGHDCWEGVYADGELFTWLQAQRRRTATAATPTAKP